MKIVSGWPRCVVQINWFCNQFPLLGKKDLVLDNSRFISQLKRQEKVNFDCR